MYSEQKENKKFSFYKKLSATDKRVYNESDRVTHLLLPYADRFQPYVDALEQALLLDRRSHVEEIAQKIAMGFCRVFKAPGVTVKVLATRPSNASGELHGLYEKERDKPTGKITLWMRTAKRKEVVSFKTFLRTLIHEVMHHLDFAHLHLADSFHTQGFYQRESSIFRQVLKYRM